MATGYNDANANVRREVNAPNIAGAASASMAKFLMFQKTRLKAVHALIVTAGTNDAAGVDIYVGTSSVGALTFGTNTAGTLLHAASINAAVPQNGTIEIKGKATSATMVGSFVLEHEVEFDADQS